MHCIVGPCIFTLYNLFRLNVQDRMTFKLIRRDKTDVGHDS